MPIAAHLHAPARRHGRGGRVTALLAVAAVALLAVSLAAPANLSGASNTAKVVVVVGPVGRHNAYYKDEAREVIAEARRHTSNVVVLFTPKATWSRVKAAAQGASILVYFGHGWGYPSNYGPFDPDRMDGMAVDPESGADGRRRVYKGENRVRASIHLAPNAAVLLYRLCYASGNTEPGLSEGTTKQSRRRVDNFGAGFLDAGAGIVLAEGHPSRPANYVRQLFTTDRSMWEVFKASPTFHRHVMGPYSSQRTPGMRYAMDPDRGGSNPSGFYRSIVGDLALRTTEVTGRVPPPTPTPDASPSIDPGPTPDPSGSIDPGPTPDPTVTPEPTGTPDATATPEPTPTPDSTQEPAPDPPPTPSPDPPPTPAPDPPTPAPTASPDPTPSPGP